MLEGCSTREREGCTLREVGFVLPAGLLVTSVGSSLYAKHLSYDARRPRSTPATTVVELTQFRWCFYGIRQTMLVHLPACFKRVAFSALSPSHSRSQALARSFSRNVIVNVRSICLQRWFSYIRPDQTIRCVIVSDLSLRCFGGGSADGVSLLAPSESVAIGFGNFGQLGTGNNETLGDEVRTRRGVVGSLSRLTPGWSPKFSPRQPVCVARTEEMYSLFALW